MSAVHMNELQVEPIGSLNYDSVIFDNERTFQSCCGARLFDDSNSIPVSHCLFFFIGLFH